MDRRDSLLLRGNEGSRELPQLRLSLMRCSNIGVAKRERGTDLIDRKGDVCNLELNATGVLAHTIDVVALIKDHHGVAPVEVAILVGIHYLGMKSFRMLLLLLVVLVLVVLLLVVLVVLVLLLLLLVAFLRKPKMHPGAQTPRC